MRNISRLGRFIWLWNRDLRNRFKLERIRLGAWRRTRYINFDDRFLYLGDFRVVVFFFVRGMVLFFFRLSVLYFFFFWQFLFANFNSGGMRLRIWFIFHQKFDFVSDICLNIGTILRENYHVRVLIWKKIEKKLIAI